jgi:hypothetical protein
METWLVDNESRIFRFLVYRKIFTPYEQERKYIDESQFEDTYYSYGQIEEAVDLGNGDWLLGFRGICDGVRCKYISYYKLSEIRLSCFDCDQDMLNEEYEEGEA